MNTEQESAQQSAVLAAEVSRLVHVAMPNFAQQSPSDFVLSNAQRGLVFKMADAWATAWRYVRTPLPSGVFDRLVQFLREKQDTLARAVLGKSALGFDVLLLGLFPINPETVLDALGFTLSVGARQGVRQHLENLRNLYTQASAFQTGYIRHIQRYQTRIMSATVALQDLDGERGHSAYEAWANDFRDRLGQSDYAQLTLLLQYGVKELLYRLFDGIKALVESGQWSEVFDMLVAWKAGAIIDRTSTAIRLSEHCAIAEILPGRTLESLSNDPANPTFLYSLPLPAAPTPRQQFPHAAAAATGAAAAAAMQPPPRGGTRSFRTPATRPAEHVPAPEPALRLPSIQHLAAFSDSGPRYEHRHDFLLQHPQQGRGDLAQYRLRSVLDRDGDPHQQQHPQQHHMDPFGGAHELGSEARSGYRAARRYAIDRREFADRARWR
ncbi:hypothetical protein JCM10908_005946 [Rhodotorula pacifica]|uniref:uncharacterized protein n=1 Tax=Rhodotorula pacifica TaxID=1495444 RepID=UPI00317DC67A